MQSRQHRHKLTKPLLAVAPIFSGDEVNVEDSLAIRSIEPKLGRNGLEKLRFNIPEVDTIIHQVPQGKSITGQRATKAAFLEIAGNYKILHLATHGKADDRIGDNSFLAFSQSASSPSSRDWLYSRELYQLRLNADMVVLSACETGVGELQRGEGIISLARGFSYAGAKSVVQSLWNVDDRSTKDMMHYFYTNLRKGHAQTPGVAQGQAGLSDP